MKYFYILGVFLCVSCVGRRILATDIETPQVPAQVVSTLLENPVENWMLYAVMATGLAILVSGVLLSCVWDARKGIPLAISGIALFATAYVIKKALLILLIIGAIVLLGVLVYGVLRYRQTIKTLIRSFEVQKDALWEEEIELKVKQEQGKLQPWISEVRKKVK